MADKLEVLVMSLDKRVNAVEKLLQKAPAADPIPALAKRVEALEKSVEQLKAIAAQLGKSLEGKKDQATIEQQAQKETRKIIDELKLQAKDQQLDARLKVL